MAPNFHLQYSNIFVCVNLRNLRIKYFFRSILFDPLYAPATCSQQAECTTIVQAVVPERGNVYDMESAKRTEAIMIKAREFEDFVQQFLRLLPRDLSRSREDFEKIVRASLNATFARMNLVTREEFDIQTQLLSNTRAALDDLEKKIATLEKALSEKQADG